MQTDGGTPLRLGAAIERLRESLAVACVGALVLGVAVGMALGLVEGPEIVRADPDRQFTFLTTLLSAIMTVVGVVLSIMVVAQQLASQQFSPRAVRTTLRDTRTRTAIGGLFGYIGFMVGAITVFGPGSQTPASVPVSMALSTGALGVVAYLIQHITNGFRSDRLVARIGADTLAAVHRIAERDDAGDQRRARDHALEDVPDHAETLRAWTSGYLQEASITPLAQSLADAGVRMRLRTSMGDFVATGTVIGWFWTLGGPPAPSQDDIRDLVEAHLRFGVTRTTEREVGSDVQQLIDIALKALSPSINDPETAVEAVNMLTTVLQQLAERRQDWLVGIVDDDLVVTIPRPLVWDFVEHTVAEIRRVGGAFPTVLAALARLLQAVALTRPDDVERAEPHLDHLLAQAEGAGLLEVDLEVIRASVERARREMHRGEVSGGDGDHQHPDR